MGNPFAPDDSIEDLSRQYKQVANFGVQAIFCEWCGGNHLSVECQVGNPFAPDDSIEDLSRQYEQVTNFGVQVTTCQWCGGNHLSENCQVGNPFAPDEPFEDFPKQQNSYSNTYNSGWSDQQSYSRYDNSDLSNYQVSTSLIEAMESFRETFSKCYEAIGKMQDQYSSSTNFQVQLEQPMATFSEGSQEDLESNMEIICNEQVDEIGFFQEPHSDDKGFEEHEEELIRSEMQQESLILENFNEVDTYDKDCPSKEVSQCTITSSWEFSNFPSNLLQKGLNDHQDDKSMNQSSQDLAKSEENKAMAALHEDCLPTEAKSQLFKPNMEFSRAQDVYTCSKCAIEAECIIKEDKQSIFGLREIQPPLKKVQFILLIQIETYVVQGVKSLRKPQDYHYAQLPYHKLGKYYEDDIIYIFNPG